MKKESNDESEDYNVREIFFFEDNVREIEKQSKKGV